MQPEDQDRHPDGPTSKKQFLRDGPAETDLVETLKADDPFAHLRDIHGEKAKAQCVAKKAAKQLAVAKVFRLLARKAAQKSRVP